MPNWHGTFIVVCLAFVTAILLIAAFKGFPIFK